MLRLVLWALGTGFVTGAVWIAIVLLRREPADRDEPAVLPASPRADSSPLDDINRRLLEVEERVDATEHVLMRDKFSGCGSDRNELGSDLLPAKRLKSSAHAGVLDLPSVRRSLRAIR
jgi:hypothetical protein